MDPNYRPMIDGPSFPLTGERNRPVWLPASLTKLDSHLELSFVNVDSIGSFFIRWGTHSDFSHVDIITPDGYRFGARTDHPVPVFPNDSLAGDTGYHAGVQKRTMNYATFTKDVRLIIPCSFAEAEQAYEWLYAQTGKPYDSTGLFQSFILNRRRDWRGNEDSWWCSELATVFVEKAGFPICRCPANGMAPNDAFIYAGCFAE